MLLIWTSNFTFPVGWVERVGGWLEKVKLKLNSTQVVVEVEVRVELGKKGKTKSSIVSNTC